MKLLRLELIAYGSLKGVELDFASREPCLHVVYGANEAGKSTALRAISGLFYGIPETTPDVHSIKGPELRVGALLRDAHGRELHVIRRKGRKDTLRSASGEPLEGADASWLSAGVSEGTFHALFGLNFASLHEGADELLGSAGDLGQSLFSAAVGGSGVRALMEALRHESEQLFKPRGQTQKLNAALKLFEEAKKRSREQAMAASAFTDQQAAIDAAQCEAERLQAEYLALRTERGRLERARRVIPLLAKQSELARERASLSAVPRLPDSAPDERRAAETARKEAIVRVKHVQSEIALHEQELAALSFDARLAELEGAAIDSLRDRLGGYRRSKAELPRRSEALARAREEVERAAARLGVGESPAGLERLRVPKHVEARLRERARLGEKLQNERRERTRVRAHKQAELERQRALLTQLWAAERAEAPDLWTRLSLPSDETAEDYERQFQALEQTERTLGERRAALELALEQNRREVETLALAGAPPTEAELTRLRAERAGLWSALRAALAADGPAPSAPGTGALVGDSQRASALVGDSQRASALVGDSQRASALVGDSQRASALVGDSQRASALVGDSQRASALLEQAIALTEQSDAVADRLRREANRVAEHARLSADQQSNERALLQLDKERALLEARRAELTAGWQALFARAGVAPRSPRETRRLLIEQRAGEARCEELERELSLLERDRLACADAEQRWRADWQTLSAELGLAENAGASEIDALLDARAELFQRHDRCSSLARELAELEHELRAFEADALALCADRLPAANVQAVDAAAEQLIRLHQATHAALARRQQLTAAIAARQNELAQAEVAQAQAEQALGQLMSAANAADLPALEAAELAAARSRQLDRALAELHDELLAASDGISSEAVLADAPGSLDEVRARLVSIDETLEELDRERQRVAQTLASCRAGLERLRESHGASDAAFDAALQLETVRTLAEQYVRTRLAASLLKREVDRYRERNKGTIVRAAGALFARLSLGSFSGLDVDYSQSDEPVLTCVRSGGERIGVEALSTGTRDQLYLALRLASIEHLATRQELMPFVLDDILVHFDDERARAALTVLAGFADTTQVLLFTHHRRLCELAEGLPAGKVRVHRLADSAPALTSLFT
jgi:uncharacterized protein YhaN